MKRILLTTTALTMTAGIAAADVSITGDFRLGFNDLATATADKKQGIYNDAGLTVAMSNTLDNGMAVGVTVDLDGGDFAAQAQDSYTLSVANDNTMIEFGSTEYSAITNWTSAGAMGTDTWANQNSDNANVLRAETTVGGLKVSISQNVDAGAVKTSAEPISLTIGGALGGATYVIANEGSKLGIAATTAAGGATITTAYSTAPAIVTATSVAHASDMDTSTGVKIAYPMGAVVATASYVMEGHGSCGAGALACTELDDTWDLSAVWTSGDTSVTFATDEGSDNKVEGSTKLGAATLAAGLTDSLNDMYISVTNPLGGGATIMASYAIDKKVADGGTDQSDEVGGPDLQEGLTVELKFAF